MFSCGIYSSCADQVRGFLKRYKISFAILLFLAIRGRAQDGFLGQYSAVFNSACNEVWTLSPAISVSATNSFTVCVYLKLNTAKNPWTAFVYGKEEPDGTLSAINYELGLTGEREKLMVWVFGNEITLDEKLVVHTWYHVCIEWRNEDQEVSLYINNTLAKKETIINNRQLLANGLLLLGCSQKPGTSSPFPRGMVGQLYMFRMWNESNLNNSEGCLDGTTIRWRKEYWVYNKTVKHSETLPCANAESSWSRQTKAQLTTPADSSIVTFVTYPNGATDSSSPETWNSAGTTNVTEFDFPSTPGIRTLGNPLCNLTDFCNDSVFYMGTVKFQTIENITNTSLDLKLEYTGNNISQVTKYQLPFSSLPLQEPKVSSFNNTLQAISELSFMQCGAENQSTSECNFIIKLDKTVNVSSALADLQEKAKIGRIELCCCSTLQLGTCPSTVEELKLLQCGAHEAVGCTGLSSTLGPPALPAGSPSTISSLPSTTPMTMSSPTVPSTQFTATLLPYTEQSTSRISPAISTKFANTILSSAPFKTTSAAISLSAMPFTKPTTASSSALTTFAIHSITSETGNSTTEPIFHHSPSSTSGINVSLVESIVSEMERALSAGTIEPKLAGEMVNTINVLLDFPQAQIAPVSKRIIKIVDGIGLKLNFSTDAINLTSSSLALAILKVNSSAFSTVSFAVEDFSDLQITLGTQAPNRSRGAITLPSSILTDLSSEAIQQASRITFNYFEKTVLFQDSSLRNLSLISHVISSSVANLTISNLKTNVTVTLQNSWPSQENSTVRCAFWDFSKNGGKGGWTYEGCVVRSRTTNETTCSCNHLTSFGVLLDFSRNSTLSPIQVLVLTFITYIGCGLSAIFLSVTLVTYIAFEKIRRDYPSKILIQLCVALLLLNLVFLLDSWIALYNVRGLCITVAVFLHYFLLVSFTWMGLEAFHMYLALVKVFNTYVRKYILKFCIIGWGVPALIVAIVLAISPDNYGVGSYGKFPNGSPDEFCWINNNIVFYITVVGYFCIIFLLNISMFIVVLVQLCRIKKKKQLGTQRKTSIQDLRSVAGLTFLLGITWGFAFFAWGPINLIFMYLFAIFNTLQGFFIFIFYCVAKENVRKQWRRYLCCGKYRLAENSDWSRTATNGLKKQNVNQGVSSSSNSLQSNSNSTNSTTVLMNNDYSVHANGNGNVSSEKNGVSFNVQNGDVRLHDFSGKQFIIHENEAGHKKSRISLRRTSKKGNLQFIEPM